MSDNEQSGTGNKPMPLPRTRTQEDYTPQTITRQSKITLDTVPPAPSRNDCITNAQVSPFSNKGSDRDSNNNDKNYRHLGGPKGGRH
ncbi:MAG: hypothetical protein PG981_001242 [Wolbachia endosymbiont of Ctenocephalides orientis wCori]|nr:MAG: hypothetical protein PG981_001242 [Wolbachia endosymbiont of Ctenocephalides orientis wCori]